MSLPAALMCLTVLLLSQQFSPCKSLRVAAFNIQQFGDEKSKNTTFMGLLTTFICKQEWDIAFLQELTDASVAKKLNTDLNTNPSCKSNELKYRTLVSLKHPVEATKGGEIYAYIYSAHRLVQMDHQDDEPGSSSTTNKIKKTYFESLQHTYEVVIKKLPPVHSRSIFAREDVLKLPVFFRPPFVLWVEVIPKKVPELNCMQKFLLIGIHTRPLRTYSELNGLVEVYEGVREDWGQENALILGDLNADVPYFGPVDKVQNPLYARKDLFKWLVEDGEKTNYGKKNQTYDRIIAAGGVMKRVARSTTVQIPCHGGALSDHRPVSVDLECK